MTFSTADLYDVHHQRVQVLAPMLETYGGQAVFSGQIVTVTCFEDNSMVKAQVSETGHGRVLVVDGGGSMRCALLGDQLAERALASGWSGLLIYGCIRDAVQISTMSLGVQALATIPKKSVRKGRGDLNIPVTFGGVTFLPGHFAYADYDGVLVSEQSLLFE